MLRIVIPGNPPTKKTSQKIIVNKATGRPMVIPSSQYREYEQFCCGTKTRPGYLAQWGNVCFTTPVNLCARYWLQDGRRKDLLNLLAATADILERAGIILNDNLVESVDGSRIMGIDKINPRVEIEITEHE